MYIFVVFLLFLQESGIQKSGGGKGKRDGSNTSPEGIFFIKLCLLNYAITLKCLKIIIKK